MTDAVQLRTVDLRNSKFDSITANRAVPRAALDISIAVDQIETLLRDVKNRGEAALVDAAQKFDGVDPRPIKVSPDELARAKAELPAELAAAIEESISRVFKVSRANLPQNTSTNLSSGAKVNQRWQPVDSVGLYVPGGKAVYPSSVIMNAVPAQVAGVQRIALASPAQANGRPHSTVLATAAILGIEDVYCMGGPAAIAAFAYGIPQIDFAPVSLVTGPGNIYVAAAKRALRGVIGIDSEAGTTEIMILADETANARHIAFDLVSQAEHDEAAASVLVTDSVELANAVNYELASVASKTSHAQRVAIALAGQQSAIVLVDDISAAIDFANFYATEHLELHTAENDSVLSRISNAGAIFMGDYSPVSLGDYLAGSSHVLPTGQQAKFGSGLGVHSFLRAQQIIEYGREGLQGVAKLITDFAAAEGLPAHGDAITARFE